MFIPSTLSLTPSLSRVTVSVLSEPLVGPWGLILSTVQNDNPLVRKVPGKVVLRSGSEYGGKSRTEEGGRGEEGTQGRIESNP